MGKYGTVSLPMPLIDKVKKMIKGTGFTSVSSYVEYVIRTIVEEKAREQKQKAFTKKEEKEVKDRLKALGYLD